uniref:Protein kinase domain-containing protein n=1 Tax=Oryzias melastigma TaxID=30732 RepID=A0A3B3C8W6_ORYME
GLYGVIFVPLEMESMKKIKHLDPEEDHLIEILHDIVWRNPQLTHLCDIRAIAQHLLKALKALKSIGLAHCDIKLDNIMLADPRTTNIKLIDFGLALETKQLSIGTVIQVNPFRAPEVILGLPMDESVDMWALGMVLATMVQILGMPGGDWRLQHDLHDEDDHRVFLDLLKRMLEIDPQNRITPSQALEHDFITRKHLSGESKAEYAAEAEKIMGSTQISNPLASFTSNKNETSNGSQRSSDVSSSGSHSLNPKTSVGIIVKTLICERSKRGKQIQPGRTFIQ